MTGITAPRVTSAGEPQVPPEDLLAPAGRFPAFASTNYRLFFSGQLISVTGTWMQTLAQSYLVYDVLHASPFQLGLVNVFQFAPVILFGIPAGVVADRFPKRRLLVVTQVTFMLLAVLLASLVAFEGITLLQVYAVAVLFGINNAFDMPIRQSFVPELVEKPALMNAIALNSTMFNTGRVLGPAIAGVVLAATGPAFCFSLNAISYLAVIAGLLLMKVPAHVKPAAGSGLERLREGIREVRENPVISRTIVLVGAMGIFGLNFNVWVPILASDSFDSGAGTYGLLFSTLGIGSLLGAFTLAMFGRKPNRIRLLTFAATLGVAEIVMGFAASIPVAIGVGMGLLACIGFTSSMAMAMANTTVQVEASDALRGRVMAVYMTVFAGTAPLGALIAGSIADRFGVGVSMGVNGTFLTILAVALVWSHRSTTGSLSPSRIATTG